MLAFSSNSDCVVHSWVKCINPLYGLYYESVWLLMMTCCIVLHENFKNKEYKKNVSWDIYKDT